MNINKFTKSCMQVIQDAEKEAMNNGYGLAKKMGHKIKPSYPALTQTICDGNDKYWKAISGVRTDAKVSLYINDKYISEDTALCQQPGAHW